MTELAELELIDVEVTAEDEELLGDEYSHCACNICHPPGTMKLGEIVMARCGKKKIVANPQTLFGPPSDACPDCVIAWRLRKCVVCDRS